MTDASIRIDAHQHFWQIERGDYGWLTPDLGALYADYQPDDLAPFLARNGISGTVLVQAAPTEAETTYMLALASTHDVIKGVVGWTDFEAPNAADRINELSELPKLVGLRPMIQDIADDTWMLQDNLRSAFLTLEKSRLVFDALTLPRHLGHLLTLLDRYPKLACVIDHGSKPIIADKKIRDWAADMKALARETNACCKLSGLVTEAGSTWTREDLKPYVDHLLEIFGPERLIWGSDWPVSTLAATYDQWVETTDWLLRDLDDADQAKVLGTNAIKVYGLDV